MLNSRKAFNYVFAGFCAAATVGTALLILAIAMTLFAKGLPALSLSFLAFDPDTGIGFHLLGTLILISTAFLVAAPLALSVGIFYSLLPPQSRRRKTLRTSFSR